MADSAITLIKTDNQITVLKDGKVEDIWYIETWDEELNIVNTDRLNTYLFGEEDE